MREKIQQQLHAKGAASKFHIPRAPEVALEVLHLSCRPTISTSQIARPLQRDPYLAGLILKMANSAAFAPAGRTIVDIREAVTRVGTANVRNILMAAAMEQSVFRGNNQELLRELWLQSLGRAVAADLITQHLSPSEPQAFAMGLLSNIGETLLVACVEKIVEEDDEVTTFEEAWKAVDDAAIAEASEQLFVAWKLPEALLDVLRSAPGSPQQTLLQMADQLACRSKNVDALMTLGRPVGLRVEAAEKIVRRFPKALREMVL